MKYFFVLTFIILSIYGVQYCQAQKISFVRSIRLAEPDSISLKHPQSLCVSQSQKFVATFSSSAECHIYELLSGKHHYTLNTQTTTALWDSAYIHISNSSHSWVRKELPKGTIEARPFHPINFRDSVMHETKTMFHRESKNSLNSGIFVGDTLHILTNIFSPYLAITQKKKSPHPIEQNNIDASIGDSMAGLSTMPSVSVFDVAKKRFTRFHPSFYPYPMDTLQNTYLYITGTFSAIFHYLPSTGHYILPTFNPLSIRKKNPVTMFNLLDFNPKNNAMTGVSLAPKVDSLGNRRYPQEFLGLLSAIDTKNNLYFLYPKSPRIYNAKTDSVVATISGTQIKQAFLALKSSKELLDSIPSDQINYELFNSSMKCTANGITVASVLYVTRINSKKTDIISSCFCIMHFNTSGKLTSLELDPAYSTLTSVRNCVLSDDASTVYAIKLDEANQEWDIFTYTIQ